MPPFVRPSLVLVLVAAQGCAGLPGKRLAFTPGDLRQELGRRIPADEVVIPFELSAEHARRAEALTAHTPDQAEKVRILLDALFDPRGFGLRYMVGVPGTAEEAFRRGGGDCLALASAFIGLARASGLDASYMDASFRMQETEFLGEQTTVKVGHITAYVRTTSDRFGLDFARMGRVYWYEPIDDLEAVAHFHNNLGYILLERGGEGAQGDWAAAAHQFDLATRVRPDFTRAWNNLGVAQVRLGRRAEARAAYKRAMALDATFTSPRLNLGSLLLEAGEVAGALEVLDSAARLDPGAPNIQYALGQARLRSGDRRGAIRALERAVALRGGWPAAQAALDQLASDKAPPAADTSAPRAGAPPRGAAAD